jgi:hypothetical protein
MQKPFFARLITPALALKGAIFGIRQNDLPANPEYRFSA